jgi:hypothetical protein
MKRTYRGSDRSWLPKNIVNPSRRIGSETGQQTTDLLTHPDRVENSSRFSIWQSICVPAEETPRQTNDLWFSPMRWSMKAPFA